MNSIDELVKESTKRKKNNIAKKRRGNNISFICNIIETGFVVLYIGFIVGYSVYLNLLKEMDRFIDFIIAGVSALILFFTLSNGFLKKYKGKFDWARPLIIIVFFLAFVFSLVMSVNKNSYLWARWISLGCVAISAVIETRSYFIATYSYELEKKNKRDEKIEKEAEKSLLSGSFDKSRARDK